MAYISSNLYLLRTSPSGVNRWQYSTTDLIAAVTGSAYFADGALRGMKPGDFIDVVIFTTYDATDGQFSGFSSYNLCCAASTSGVTATAAAISAGGSSTLTANSTATAGFTAGDIVISGAGNLAQALTPGRGVASALAIGAATSGGFAMQMSIDPVASYAASGTTATTTGTITASSTSLVVASASGWSIGMGIAVAGAGVAGPRSLIANLIGSLIDQCPPSSTTRN